ncbi:hypothetical protein ECFRIK1999_3355, partial [Escherichia coli FRIK1999]
RVR